MRALLTFADWRRERSSAIAQAMRESSVNVVLWAAAAILGACGSGGQPPSPPPSPAVSEAPSASSPASGPAAPLGSTAPLGSSSTTPSSVAPATSVSLMGVGVLAGPHARVVDVQSKGDLHRDLVKQIAWNEEAAFTACYRAALEKKPDAKGTVVAHFKVGPDGSVLGAVTTTGSTLGDKEAVTCVARVFKDIGYVAFGDPEIGGSPTAKPDIVDFTLEFAP